MAAEGDKPPREHPRVEVNAFVDYTGTEVGLYHRVVNLSLGGVCIQTEGVEPVGTIVELVINFPDQDTSISARGEVMWANQEPPKDMGIRFLDLDQERKDTLRRHLGATRKR